MRNVTDRIQIIRYPDGKFEIVRTMTGIKTRKELELDLKNLEIENEKLGDMLEDNTRKIEELKLALASTK